MDVLDKALSVAPLLLCIAVGLYAGMQCQRGYRFVGVGLIMVGISSFIMTPEPPSQVRFILQSVLALGGLTCGMIGLHRMRAR